MKGKTHHLDRKFIRLYTFSIAWAFFGAAAPALLRGITWLGILLAVYGILVTLLGLHPRTARERYQTTLVVWSYGPVIVCVPFTTGFIGLFLGAFRNPLWLLYFATVLGLFAATIEAFARTIRRPPPSSANSGRTT